MQQNAYCLKSTDTFLICSNTFRAECSLPQNYCYINKCIDTFSTKWLKPLQQSLKVSIHSKMCRYICVGIQKRAMYQYIHTCIGTI